MKTLATYIFTSDDSIFESNNFESMFKSNKWSHRFVTVSAALPLSDLIVGVENITSVQVKSP